MRLKIRGYSGELVKWVNTKSSVTNNFDIVLNPAFNVYITCYNVEKSEIEVLPDEVPKV